MMNHTLGKHLGVVGGVVDDHNILFSTICKIWVLTLS